MVVGAAGPIGGAPVQTQVGSGLGEVSLAVGFVMFPADAGKKSEIKAVTSHDG